MRAGNWIAYDGDCPFCTAYTAMLRLRESIGPVELINIRENEDIVQELTRQQFDLDEGMVLKLNGEYFYGDDCVHRLALLSTSSGVFNCINAFIFRNQVLAAVIYPILKAGRRVVLFLLGRDRIRNLAA